MELVSHRGLTEDETGSNWDQEQNSALPKGDKGPSIPTRSPFLSFMNNYWVWEVISCIGSLVALICIIGVLLNYDGKPIPNWPYGITINSVLSWITQVFSALMLGTVAACLSQNAWIHFNMRDRPLSNINSYHSASRGVWGCMTFLWEVKMRFVSLSTQYQAKLIKQTLGITGMSNHYPCSRGGPFCTTNVGCTKYSRVSQLAGICWPWTNLYRDTIGLCFSRSAHRRYACCSLQQPIPEFRNHQGGR